MTLHRTGEAMGALQAIGPLDFDYDGAERLAREFDAMAELLEDQSAQRPRVADTARSPWDGRLRLQFDDRVATCVADGQRLSDAMRTAAKGLRELAEAARAEDERRAWAREYEQQQEDLRWWERAGRNIADFFTGRDAVPSPPEPPSPPTYEVLTTVSDRC